MTKKPIKIVYLYHTFAIFGGVERIVTDKMNIMAQNEDYKIYLVTTAQGKHPLPFPLDNHITHIDLNLRFHDVYLHSNPMRQLYKWKKDRLFKKRMRYFLDQEKPDKIISIDGAYARIIRKIRRRIPWIVVYHSDISYFTAEDGVMNLWKKFDRKRMLRAIHKADKLVVLTQSEAQRWSRTNSNCTVIPNGILLPQDRKQSTHQNKQVIFAGRFCYQKGNDTLFDMWKEIHKHCPEWSLEVYGEGGEKSRFMHLNNKQNIHIYEPSRNIFDKYSESSILLFTSRYEPFGLVIVEAMSCGIPVVAFDCPYGPRDIITDGEDGYLIPVGDKKLFEEKVVYLMEHPEERKRMGYNAQQKASLFSMGKAMRKWEKLFQEMAG